MSHLTSKYYNPAELSVIINSHPISRDIPTDTFLSIEPNSDITNETVGSRGNVTQAPTNDKMWVMTLTLIQSSPSNDYLSSLALEGLAFPVLVKDHLGTTVMESPKAWVKRWPTLEYAQDPSNREWTLCLSNGVPFVGGNDPLPLASGG